MPHKVQCILTSPMPVPDHGTFAAHMSIGEEEEAHFDLVVSGCATEHGVPCEGTGDSDAEYGVLKVSSNLFRDMWDVPDMLEADLVLRQRAQAAQLAAKKSSKSLRAKSSKNVGSPSATSVEGADGVPSDSDATRYEGQIVNGVPHGYGCFFVYGAVSGRYEGEVVNGKADGLGTFTGLAIRFEGEWYNGLRHGIGCMIYARREVFIGEWKRGKRHGYGLAFATSGKAVYSRWEDDREVGFHLKLMDDAVPSSGALTYRPQPESYYEAQQAYDGESLAEASLRRLHRTGGLHMVPTEQVEGYVGTARSLGDRPASRRRLRNDSLRRPTSGSMGNLLRPSSQPMFGAVSDLSPRPGSSSSQRSRPRSQLATRATGEPGQRAHTPIRRGTQPQEGGAATAAGRSARTPSRKKRPGTQESVALEDQRASKKGINTKALTQHRREPDSFPTTYRDFSRHGGHRERQLQQQQQQSRKGRPNSSASSVATGMAQSDNATGGGSRRGTAISGDVPGVTAIPRGGMASPLRRPGSSASRNARPGSGSLRNTKGRTRGSSRGGSRRRVTIELEAEVATVERDGSFRRPSSTLRLGSRSGSRGRLDELDFGAPQSPIATAQHRDGWEPRRSSASGDGSTALVTPAGSVSSRVLTGEEATLDGGADRRAAFPELLRTAPASSSAVPPLSLPAPLHETKQGAGNEETKGVEGQGSPDTARQVARASDDGVADPEAAALAIARGVPGTSSALVVAGKDVGGGARPVPSTSVPPPQLLPGFQEAERRRATELVSKGGMYQAFVPARIPGPQRRGSLNQLVNPFGNVVVPIDRHHAPPAKSASHHVLCCRNAVRNHCEQLRDLVTAKQNAMRARLFTQRVVAESKRGDGEERLRRKEAAVATIALCDDRKYLANRSIRDSSHGTSIAKRERIDLIRRIKKRLPVAKQLEMDVLQTRQQKEIATERRKLANNLVRDVERLKAKLIGIGVPEQDIEAALVGKRVGGRALATFEEEEEKV